MTLALDPGPSRRLGATESRMGRLALFIALAAVPLGAALMLDARQFGGESVWVKPLKFHLALTVYFATLAFMARWLPAGMEAGRPWRWFLGVAMVMTGAELVWIGGAAALGVASHFNTASPFWQVVYGVMGLAATVLTALTLVMGGRSGGGARGWRRRCGRRWGWVW